MAQTIPKEILQEHGRERHLLDKEQIGEMNYWKKS